MNDLEEQPTSTVRLATVDEAEAIAAVLRGAFAEYEPLYTEEAFAVTTPGADQIRDRWQEGPVWVGLLGGRVVGTVAAVPGEQALYVRSMGILAEARGHGLGLLLLEQVETYARRHNLKHLYLSTTPFLRRAIRLYQRFGFAQTDEGPQELQGTPLFTMEKTLHPPPG